MVRIVRVGFGAFILVLSLPEFANRCNETLYALSEIFQLIQTGQPDGRRTTGYRSWSNATLSVRYILGSPDIALTLNRLSPDDSFYKSVGTAGSLMANRPADHIIKYSKQCRQDA